MHQGVWDVVCLASLNALEMARALLFQRTSVGAAAGLELAEWVGRRAVAKFWGELADFCGLNLAPAEWQDLVPAGHPFLAWDTVAARWRVRRQAVVTVSD